MRKRAGLFLLLVVLGGWPSVAWRSEVSAALSPVLSSLLAPFEFGEGGRAMVRSAPGADVRRAGQNVTADAELRLTIDGYPNESLSAINLRHDFYLPLWIAASAALSAWPHRLLTMALAVPTVFAACFGSLYVTVCWLFAHQAAVIYPLDARSLQRLDALVGTLLMPPSLRFFVPLLITLAAALLAEPLSASVRASRPRRRMPPAAPPAAR